MPPPPIAGGGGKEKQNHYRDSDGDHDDANRKGRGETDGATSTTAIKSRVRPCTNFLVYGNCRNEECVYDHVSPDDVKKWRVKHGIDNPDGSPKKKKKKAESRHDHAKNGRHGRVKSKKAKRKESESGYSSKESETGSDTVRENGSDTEIGKTSESEDHSDNKQKKKTVRAAILPLSVQVNMSAKMAIPSLS